MKRFLAILIILISIVSCSVANASQTVKIPSNASSAIAEMSTSVKALFAGDNDVLAMMANLVILDYSAYNKKFVPDYDHNAYVGKTDTILYFAIPNSKGIYYLFGYLPAVDTLMFVGEDSLLSNEKDVISVFKSNCDDYKKLTDKDMLIGANYILSIFK